MTSTFCIVAAFLMVSQTLAFEVGNGPCPDNMTAVADLDMNRLEGKWYTVLMYPDLTKNVPKCKSINILLDTDKKYSMNIKSIDRRFGTVKTLHEKIYAVDPKSGYYILGTKNRAFPKGVQVYILDTDYESFSIHYMCFDADKVINFQWASIYTRSRMPSVDAIYAAKTLAEFSGLDVKKFIRIPQEGCPIDT